MLFDLIVIDLEVLFAKPRDESAEWVRDANVEANEPGFKMDLIARALFLRRLFGSRVGALLIIISLPSHGRVNDWKRRDYKREDGG
jgi:hypothetical protein